MNSTRMNTSPGQDGQGILCHSVLGDRRGHLGGPGSHQTDIRKQKTKPLASRVRGGWEQILYHESCPERYLAYSLQTHLEKVTQTS